MKHLSRLNTHTLLLTLIGLMAVSLLGPIRPALAADGPWLVYTVGGNPPNQLWIANRDGSGPSKLLEGRTIWHMAVSGRTVALVTGEGKEQFLQITLRILSLPNGKELFSLPLTSAATEPSMKDGYLDVTESVRAITFEDNLAWSPDGTRLAFMGAYEGPSSDLYVYTLATNAVLRLTTGASEGIAPSWSPDGQWIVHFGVTSLGSGAGATMAGAWAARADGRQVRTLYTPESGGEQVIGWTDARTVIVASWNALCGWNGIREVNIDTKDVGVMWQGYFDSAAFNPTDNQLLVSVGDYSIPECQTQFGAGLVLITLDETREILDREMGPVVWSAPNGIFFAYNRDGVLAISTRAEITELGPIGIPVVSPDAEAWAWVYRGKLYAGFIQPGNQPVEIVTDGNVNEVQYTG